MNYLDEAGQRQKMDLPMTFADFAASEGRFAKQFRKAPPETWNEQMMPLAEFLELAAEDREGLFPYIWAIDGKNRLMRLLVAEPLVRSSEERLHYWRQLKDIAGVGRSSEDAEAIAERIRIELLQKITTSLGLSGSDVPAVATAASQAGATGAVTAAAARTPAADGYEPCWVETPECTACDECTTIAPKVFAYNDQKRAIVIDPRGARFADIVKAAEKCTAGCLHPGTPWNAAEPGLDKLKARAAKFN
jgi:pyruvate-ferredoxin/flavodoxin oxidoreductase